MAAAIPAAAMLVGGLLRWYGGRRQTSAQNRYNTEADQKARQDAENRARAMAAIYRSILQHYGYGDYATDDQLFNAMLRAPGHRPQQAGPSVFGPIGSALETYGQGGLGAARGAAAGGAGSGVQPGINIPMSLSREEGFGGGDSNSAWAELMRMILEYQRRSPMEGGANAGYMTPGHSPGL